MTATEIKQKIVAHLDGISDTDLLVNVLNIVNGEAQKIHYFTEEEHKLLDEAEREIEVGKFYTNDEVNKMADESIKK